mmetsp:Transcript_6386/g.24006  ORF Transcript_6386/g.24006 Transcript_6386/m.24006 type:complete len:178 (+) Transcript_6386:1451-1984(+)
MNHHEHVILGQSLSSCRISANLSAHRSAHTSLATLRMRKTDHVLRQNSPDCQPKQKMPSEMLDPLFAIRRNWTARSPLPSTYHNHVLASDSTGAAVATQGSNDFDITGIPASTGLGELNGVGSTLLSKNRFSSHSGNDATGISPGPRMGIQRHGFRLPGIFVGLQIAKPPLMITSMP